MTSVVQFRTRLLLLALALAASLFLIMVQTASADGTVLSAGDIAIIGVNSDGDDDFAFVLLKDVAAGTSLYVTDKGWNDASGFFTVAGDGVWQWSTSVALSRGTVIHVTTSDNGVIIPDPLSADPGTITWVENNSTVVSYMGDQVFLYQGTEASPTLIAGCTWNVESGSTTANWDGSAVSAMTSALPDQLTNGETAIWLYEAGESPTERDNFKYNGITSGSPAQLRAAINTLSNWLVDTTTVSTGNPYDLETFPTFTVEITNTAPTLAHNTGMTVNEGASKTITQAMLQVTDAEQAASALTYTLTAVPANGTLYNGATALSLSGTKTFTQADIDGSSISYTHNGGETTSDSFKFTVSDGDGGSISETTFSITVTSVNDAPQATSVQLSGTTIYGQALTGSYTYVDAETDPEGTSTFQWYRADSAAGLNHTAISGATLSTYTLAAADVEKYISFAVTPAAQTGTSPGATVQSAWSSQIQKADCETTTVEAPVLSGRTTSSITLVSVSGYEYTRVAENAEWNTGTWQDATLFDGLSSGATHDFYQRVKETDTHKASAVSAKLTVTTLAAPSITTTSLPNGVTEQAYSQVLAATGTTPITWTIASGSLPAGLSLSGVTISGTPATAGSYNFTVKAENTVGSDTQALSIVVSAAPTITTISLPNGTTGQAYSQMLEATGTTPITWTIESGGLPAGVSLSGDTISGTPSAAGTFNFTVKAENTAGNDTQALSITVADPTYTASITPTSKSFPDAVESYGEQVATEFTITNTGTGQLTNLSAQISAGSGYFEISTALANTSLSATNSTTVSVRPQTGLAVDDYTGTLTVTGDHGISVSAALAFTVNEAPTYTISAAPDPVAFGSLAEGYLPVSAKLVTVTNTGNQSVTLSQPSAVNYTLGALSATQIQPAGTATFTIAPKDGLTAGNWDEVIQIQGSNGASTQVTAKFTCTVPVPYQITSGGGSFYLQSGETVTIVSNGLFANFTGLTSNGALVGGWNYDLTEGSCIITLHNDYLNSLPVGTYAMRFHFMDGYAETNLTINEAIPQTGDDVPVLLYWILAALTAGTLILLGIKRIFG